MAGTYPDIPGTRFALDKDGSVISQRNATIQSAWTDKTASIGYVLKLNTSEYIEYAASNSPTIETAIGFPEPRTISGLYLHVGTNISGTSLTSIGYQYSTDTTDGTDGTWQAFNPSFSYFGYHNDIGDASNSKPYYRTDIATVSLTGVRGIRFSTYMSSASIYGHRFLVIHIYGSRPITGVDRLTFWDPTQDQALAAAALDFGDMMQGTSTVRQFRIKNLSSTLSANGISVAVSDLLPEYVAGDVEVSTDNSAYYPSIAIGDLAAGATSSVLYVKRTVSGSETTALRHARLLADATTWT